MSLVNDAMIVNLNVGIWMGYRLDREATRKVTSEAGAVDDAARVNKHLIPREALKPLVATAGAVRAHFYDRTLPWKDNGDRVLPRKMYERFIPEHSELVGKFQSEVNNFLENTYLVAKEQAEFRMGDLFKADDYPRPSELKPKFYINLDIDAVTESGDFRVTGLDPVQVAAIREDMERATCDRINRAMSDVWARLAETLGHFASKMSSDEIFRDSTVRNLEEIIGLMPALNILNDPKLEAIRLDIEQSIIGYRPGDLRKDPKIRDMAASEAQRIMEEMKGFMTAMSGTHA